MRREHVLVGGLCAAPLVVASCQQVLGVTGDTTLRTESSEAGSDTGAEPDVAIPPAPDAGADGATPGKICDGHPVGQDDPQFGCGHPDSCKPCSLAFANGAKCDTKGRCAPTTCQPGHDHCSANPEDGCEADLLSPTTCKSCTTSCPVSEPLCGPAGCDVGCGALATCGKSCVNLATNVANCGTCGNGCTAPPDSDATCAASTCGYVCHAGYSACGTSGCVPLQLYYRDADGDTYGTTSDTVLACPGAQGTGYVSNASDCLDSNAGVHPGAGFATAPFLNAAGESSYDYDCSNTEDEKLGYLHFVTCQAPACGGAGWRPADPRPGKLPGNADPFCGSSNVTNCSGSGSCSSFSGYSALVPCR